MSGSVAGTSHGGETPPAKRAKTGSRCQQKQIALLGASIAGLEEQRFEQDMEYVNTEFRGPSKDLLSVVATMMRGGSLRAALTHQDTLNKLGKRLAPSCDVFRCLNSSFCRTFIKQVEPGLFPAGTDEGDDVIDPWNELSHKDWLHTVYWALHVKGATKLPIEYEILRYELPLLQYLAARYIEQGRRLAGVNPADRRSMGFFSRDGTTVKFKLTGEGGAEFEIEVPSLASGDDWVIENNFGLDAILKSAEQAIYIKLAAAFTAKGHNLNLHFPTVLELPASLLPPSITSTHRTIAQDIEASASSLDMAPPPAKAMPRAKAPAGTAAPAPWKEVGGSVVPKLPGARRG